MIVNIKSLSSNELLNFKLSTKCDKLLKDRGKYIFTIDSNCFIR